MPKCKECNEETDELVRMRVEGRSIRVCEDCADYLREQAEIAQESESAIQQMMEFKGRR